MSELELFGILEDGEHDKNLLSVRLLGHKIGESDGWFHWDGLCVVFPNFLPSNPILKHFMLNLTSKNIHLIIDFYDGNGALLTKSGDDEPVIHKKFNISDLNLGDDE